MVDYFQAKSFRFEVDILQFWSRIAIFPEHLVCHSENYKSDYRNNNNDNNNNNNDNNINNML